MKHDGPIFLLELRHPGVKLYIRKVEIEIKLFFYLSMPRKYSPKAGQKVKRAMHEMKRGKLKSGRSGKTVRSRKQAIAIGLSEARRAGAKVPKTRRSR